MKHIILAFMVLASSAYAETVSLVIPNTPAWPVGNAYRKIIDKANFIQNEYNFVMEFKPGGEQLIAPKHVEENPANRITVIAPKFADHLLTGKIKEGDFVPIHSIGEACWGVITNIGDEQEGIKSLRGKDIFVGSVGFGNATHLTALEIGKRLNSNVTYVSYKSNADALLSLVSNSGLNFVIERISSYENFKQKNPNLKLLAISCDKRLPKYPNVKTLKEQGIDAPQVFFITLAHKNMDIEKRNKIARALNTATMAVGETEIYRLSDSNSPLFDGVDINEYYNSRITNMKKYIKRYASEIEGKK